MPDSLLTLSLLKTDFSTIIKEVTEERPEDELGGHGDVLCSFCEMTLMWIRTKLLQNTTRDKIFEYVNKVRSANSFLFCDISSGRYRHILMITKNLQLKLCDNLPDPARELAVDCDRIKDFPSVSFVIGNRVFHLSPQQVRAIGFLQTITSHALYAILHRLLFPRCMISTYYKLYEGLPQSA